MFDVSDGRLLQRHDLDASIAGLACFANGGLEPPPPPPTPGYDVVPTATPCRDGTECPVRCPDPGAVPLIPLHQLPPSIDTGSCSQGGRSSNYALAAGLSDSASEELHVIGVYEGIGLPGFAAQRRGVVDVRVEARPRPVALVLSSYDSTHWRIALEAGAALSRVLVRAYGEQTIEGVPEGVAVVQIEPCESAYGWEVEHGGGERYQSFVADVRSITGLQESSFQGCYQGARFEVPYWSGDPPLQAPTPIAGDESLARRQVELPGCDTVVGESHYCLTGGRDGISAVGLDTGASCRVVATSAPLAHGYTTSFAWRGELLYACTNAGLVRVSLRDGSWEKAQVECAAVVDHGPGLLVMSAGDASLRSYPDYQAVLDRASERTYEFKPWSDRIAVHGQRLYEVSHASPEISVRDLTVDAPLGSIDVDDGDWTLGMWAIAALDEETLAVSDAIDRVALFDLESGAEIREVPLAEPSFGLVCTSRASGE